jgi:hypothetical protein
LLLCGWLRQTTLPSRQCTEATVVVREKLVNGNTTSHMYEIFSYKPSEWILMVYIGQKGFKRIGPVRRKD